MGTSSATVELLYPRSRLSPGSVLPLSTTYNSALVAALCCCESLVINPSFRLFGDSLLFLATVKACLDYLAIARTDGLPQTYIPYEHLHWLRHNQLLTEAHGLVLNDSSIGRENRGNSVILTDEGQSERLGYGFAYDTEEYVFPKYKETVDGQEREYSSRPARYYIGFEQQIGIRLPVDDNDWIPPFLFAGAQNLHGEAGLPALRLNHAKDCAEIALILATSYPDRKDFGADNFVSVARCLAEAIGQDSLWFWFILPLNVRTAARIHLEQSIDRHELRQRSHLVHEKDLEALGALISRCKLVIGNDTGITHYASLCVNEKHQRRASTIILYSRADYTKWTSGARNIFPIATPFSEYLRRHNLSPTRDNIDDAPWGDTAKARFLSVDEIAGRAISLLQLD